MKRISGYYLALTSILCIVPLTPLFVVNSTTTTIKTDIADIFGSPVEMILFTDDGGVEPSDNEVINYLINLGIVKGYPNIGIQLEVEERDDTNNNVTVKAKDKSREFAGTTIVHYHCSTTKHELNDAIPQENIS
jgi:hypothetical protein